MLLRFRSLAAIGMLTVAGAAMAAKPQKAAAALLSPQLIDATGKTVAPYYPNVSFVQVNGALLAIPVESQIAGGYPDATLLQWGSLKSITTGSSLYRFASADCSGPPLVTVSASPDSPLTVAGARPATYMRNAANEVVAYIGKAGPVTQLSYQSSTFYPGVQGYCDVQSGTFPGWLLESTAVITSLYPEPLHIELR